MQTMKKHANHGISAFELTQKTLNNLKYFNIGATAKNVLWYLTACYNPKNKYVFPKQKTIASVIGCSERSVVRAIQELVKEGLIIIESTTINKYAFTSKILGEPSQKENVSQPVKMSQMDEKISPTNDNLSHHEHEPTMEEIKEPLKVEDFKILKEYAQKHNAKNVNAYINTLKRNGSAKQIISEYKRIKANSQAMLNNTQKVIQDLEFAKNNAVAPPPEFFNLKKKLLCNKM